MSSDVREPALRLASVEWLARPQLVGLIDAILHRFDTGEDPLPDDEVHVSALLRTRALLDVGAPEPDPLASRLAELDAVWSVRSSVHWVLADPEWLSCFADLPLPSPRDWWGARLDPRTPSQQAVLRALQDLEGAVKQDVQNRGKP